MTTAEDLLAEDGSVRIAAGLDAAWAHAALAYALRELSDRNGLPPSHFARALMTALKRAAEGSSFAPETPAATPATVMLGMEEVAALKGCTPQWARRLAARGELPGAQRVGRIWLVPSTSLDAFRHEREEAPDGEAASEDREGRGSAAGRGSEGAADTP